MPKLTRWVPGTTTDIPPIVEGRNTPGMVETNVMESRTPFSDDVQSWLSNHAAQDVSGDPFNEYPTGNPFGDAPSRHPLIE
jgi:hypothetical protein